MLYPNTFTAFAFLFETTGINYLISWIWYGIFLPLHFLFLCGLKNRIKSFLPIGKIINFATLNNTNSMKDSGIIYVEVPNGVPSRVSFFLAMEEYVARTMPAADYFFMWQVSPSVIFGRNQVIEAEVNIPYCRQNEIAMYRRKSGGGCVYADLGNIMFSYVTADEHVGLTFNRYLNLVVLMLQKLGVDAVATGRNDIMTDGKKLSGNAFYHIPGRSIVHGTMLYDTHIQHMVASITPSDEKLMSKGVKSVRQHVALLKDYIKTDIEGLKQHARATICSETVALNADDVLKIKQIEEEYLSDAFIFGNDPAYTTIHKSRIEGAGEVEVRLEIRGGKIKKINLLGDYFLYGDLDSMLLPLKDIAYTRDAVEAALSENVGEIIRGMEKKDLVGLILKN